MKLCWLEDPNARPSFSELTIKLKQMENRHKVRFKQERPWTILSLPQICLPSLASLELQTYGSLIDSVFKTFSNYASLAVNYGLSPCLFLITNKSEEIAWLLTGLFCCQLREQADCQKSMIRLRTWEKICRKAKRNSPTNLQHSLLIRLLKFEITLNAGVLFFFSFGGSRKQFLLTGPKRRLRSRLLIWLVNLYIIYVFSFLFTGANKHETVW